MIGLQNTMSQTRMQLGKPGKKEKRKLRLVITKKRKSVDYSVST